MSKSITSKGKIWELGNSIWMLWALLTLGFLNYISFFYIASRVKQKKWTKAGFIYSVPFILLIVTSGVSNDHWITDVTVAIYLISYIISIIHVFKIRPEYLLRLQEIQKNPDRYESLKKEIQTEYHSNSSSEPKVLSNVRQETSIVETPIASVEENNKIIDLNRATVHELTEVPHFGGIFAKKAVMLREEKGGFSSYNDFTESMNLKPHIAEKIRPYLKVSNKERPSKEEKTTGRIVDY
ncbi:hypothetical protein GLW07_21910 [Bacillus hwajinpoensis]|uniref:Helix-hairpin-helix domain-containing protein n=1 Tax=Guptibacillus hwajinpoensis TaxID=208199 RepID=A0A845F5I3_9BACL|nr:helix-hairpin-helix domain-containing protein [Pseudalkalibacillus hwajinpoensis]MYL65998.1 hypothetical protein [Pseudalkalibacillus hwajinpoensis]